MSLWTKLFGNNSHERNGVNAADVIYGLDSSPLSIDKKAAIALPAFYAGLKVLGETVASLKREVLLRKPNGDVIPAKDHPLYNVLRYEASPLYSSHSWDEAAIINGASQGNDYTYIKRNNRGEVEALYIIPSDRIYMWVHAGKMWYRDVVSKITYSSEEMMHCPWLSYDGIHGLSAIEYHSSTLGVGLRGTEYGENVLRNGAFIQGLLTTEGKLTPDQRTTIINGWRKAYNGSENSGKTPILEGGLKFQPVRMKPADIEFMKVMKANINDVAMILRVPLHLLQQLERSTNNNIEHQSIDFVVHTIRPIVKRREAEMNRKLLTAKERAEGYHVRYNIDSLLRGDAKARAEFYSKLWSMGAINADEIRALEHMNKLPDGQGEKYYVQLNLANTNTDEPVGQTADNEQ